jgi:hypothetical protein
VAAVALPAKSVGTRELKPNAVRAAQIATNAVGAPEIATNGVGAGEIASNAVGPSELRDGVVGASDIQAGAVGTRQIADGAIRLQDIASGVIPEVARFSTALDQTAFDSVDRKTLVVSCDEGQRVVSGGGFFDYGNPAPATPPVVAITGSYSSERNSVPVWIVEAAETQPTNDSWRLNGQAICFNRVGPERAR